MEPGGGEHGAGEVRMSEGVVEQSRAEVVALRRGLEPELASAAASSNDQPPSPALKPTQDETRCSRPRPS